MTERLTEDQEQTAKEASREINHFWDVMNHPEGHSAEEVKKAALYVVEQINNLATAVELGLLDVAMADELAKGLYHIENKTGFPSVYSDPRNN